MNLQDEITYGHMTLRQLSELIESNLIDSGSLQVHLSWGFEHKHMYGRISSGTGVLIEKYYQGRHVHLQIAQMHLDFQKSLMHLIAQRLRELRPGRGGGEAGMSKGRQVGSNINENYDVG